MTFNIVAIICCIPFILSEMHEKHWISVFGWSIASVTLIRLIIEK